MKTSNFIKRIKELGYEAVEVGGIVRVLRDLDLVAIVPTNKVNKLDTFWSEDITHELFHVLINYASTPVGKREDVKKYYLYNNVQDAYFNYYIEEGRYDWLDSTSVSIIQTQFTEEEIRNHKFKDIMELLEKEEA